MATFTVDSIADDGSGGLTLREALAAAEAAAGEDMMVCAHELKNQTIILQDRLLIEDADGVVIRATLKTMAKSTSRFQATPTKTGALTARFTAA